MKVLFEREDVERLILDSAQKNFPATDEDQLEVLFTNGKDGKLLCVEVRERVKPEKEID